MNKSPINVWKPDEQHINTNWINISREMPITMLSQITTSFVTNRDTFRQNRGNVTNYDSDKLLRNKTLNVL